MPSCGFGARRKPGNGRREVSPRGSGLYRRSARRTGEEEVGQFRFRGPRGSDAGDCIGDEEYVNIMPPAQFLAKYSGLQAEKVPSVNITLSTK